MLPTYIRKRKHSYPSTSKPFTARYPSNTGRILPVWTGLSMETNIAHTKSLFLSAISIPQNFPKLWVSTCSSVSLTSLSPTPLREHAICNLHFPHAVVHLYPSQSQYNTSKASAIPKKKENLSSVCWSHKTASPISLNNLSTTHAKENKTIMYTSPFHYILHTVQMLPFKPLLKNKQKKKKNQEATR